MRVEPVEATPATLLALAAGYPREFPLFFDSSAAGVRCGWSMLAALPDASIRLQGDGRLDCDGVAPAEGFLKTLDQAWRAAHWPRWVSENRDRRRRTYPRASESSAALMLVSWPHSVNGLFPLRGQQ